MLLRGVESDHRYGKDAEVYEELSVPARVVHEEDLRLAGCCALVAEEPSRIRRELGQGMTHVKGQFAHLFNPRLFALVLAPVACRRRQRHATSAMRFGLTAVSTARQADAWLLI